MNVAICFSGEVGRTLATEVRNWLPLVLDQVTPFCAPHDIRKSRQWFDDLNQQIGASDAALLCLTDDQPGPWLYWEAGKARHPYPLAFGFKPKEVLDGPIGHLQFTTFDRDEMEQLVVALNDQEGGPHVDQAALTRRLDAAWPGLEAKVRQLLSLRPRDFPERIDGAWWERVEQKESTAISYVRLETKDGAAKARLQGVGYGRDGRYTAEWHSTMVILDAASLRLIYAWEGTSEAAKQGMGEIRFSETTSGQIASGHGVFTDDGQGQYLRKLFRIARATDQERETMDGADETRKSSMAAEMIRKGGA